MSSERYIAVNVYTETGLEKREFIGALNSEAKNLLGDVGAASLNLWVYDVEKDKIIIGCGKDKVKRARAVIACVDKVGEERIRPVVKGVSGTIKKARALLR